MTDDTITRIHWKMIGPRKAQKICSHRDTLGFRTIDRNDSLTSFALACASSAGRSESSMSFVAARSKRSELQL